MKVTGLIKHFFENDFNKYLFIILVLIGIVMVAHDYYPTSNSSPPLPNATNQTNISKNITVDFFYHPQCPHCSQQRPIIEELEQEFAEIGFFYHDTSKPSESKLFQEMARENGLTGRLGVPTTFIGEKTLEGFHPKDVIKKSLLDCLEKCTNESKEHKVSEQNVTYIEQENKTTNETKVKEFNLPLLGKTDLMSFSLPVLAVLLGSIDGFNPCAMWVLVYMISVIANVPDKKKVWLIVGSFVFASGVLYFLFMTAWLNAFLLLGYVRFITIGVGLVALGAGILNLKSYLKGEGMTCEVGDEESHKETMNKIQEIAASPLSWGIFFAIIALAFAVNSIEFICSSAIPAVFTQVLALNNLPWYEYYLYIAIYDFFFMLDDLIIFSMAAFAISQTTGTKYAKLCKLIGGLIMLLLGLIMLFAPGWLGNI